ncbi:hypothetical protein [Kutzneria sp. CA-103260]|uniref:hypothetical protein n=1 Tax=Kutzneria sp. CA-103260 TaxID=2802641 RepID=UPI001BA70225|nr:hypothetical protein [Kutzneria sp. CA-103260]
MLAALLAPLARATLRRIRLLVSPDTGIWAKLRDQVVARDGRSSPVCDHLPGAMIMVLTWCFRIWPVL